MKRKTRLRREQRSDSWCRSTETCGALKEMSSWTKGNINRKMKRDQKNSTKGEHRGKQINKND
jgi:hypothetical protein